MTIRPDAPKRFSAMKLASAISLAPLLLPLLAGSPVQAAPCPESRALVFTAERPPSQMSVTPMPEIAIGDQAVFHMAGGTQCGPYDRVTGFHLMSSSASPMTMPPHSFKLVHEDADGDRVETGLGPWPASDGTTDFFDGRDPRGLWQVARIPSGPAPGPAREHFRLALALAEAAQQQPATAQTQENDTQEADEQENEAPGAGTAQAGPFAQSGSGQPAWLDDPDALEMDTDHPQMQPLQPTPGIPLPTGPDLSDPGPLIDPALPDLVLPDPDLPEFMPDGQIETVTDGYLEAPRWVEAGRNFTARWDDRLSRSDRVTIVPINTPDHVLGEGQQNIRVRNNSSASLRAPDELGTHEVRYFSDEDQSVHARVTVEVADPIIEIEVADEVHAGRDFRVEWGDRLSRSDRVTIVPIGTPDTELGEGQQNIRVRNNSSNNLRAPDELGTYEVRYFRTQQERVVGRAIVELVDPVIEIDVAEEIHAGREFRVEWGDRLSRSDRVTIVPIGTPDTELGEGQQNIRVRNNSSNNLRAPDELGTYEVRYFRSQQERVVGRAVVEAVDPDILVLAPVEVAAGSDFDVTWSDRLSRNDRVTIVHAGAPDDVLGDGRQNIRVRNNDSGTLRAPSLQGEFEVRYFRNQQGRVAGRALVTVLPEGSDVVSAEPEGTPSVQDLVSLMDRLEDLAARLDDVAAEERQAVREELIGYGPHAIDLIMDLVDDGRIAPWQAAGFVGGSFDPPPPPPATAGGSGAQAPGVTPQQAQAATAGGALSAQDERRIIMLIARLEGVAPHEQQPIIDELAGYGPAATDLLLEMMQDGLIDRPLALRAAAAIEADGEAPQQQPQMQQAPQQQAQMQPAQDQQPAQQPSGYQVTGVAPNDMLNVRDRAGVSGSNVVGRLAPDARDIMRSGNVQDVGGRDWWHIRHPSLPAEGGWVNSRFLTAQAGLAPEDTAYRVTGVAAGDALNIRSFPGTDGDILARVSPDAGGLRWTGESAAVGSGTWWELAHPDLPGGTGWVNSRFLEAQEGVAVASLADPALGGLRPPFTEAEGYAAIDHGAVLDRLFETLPQTSAIFPPGGRLNPLTKAILMLENEEGVVPHARYRIRYAMEGRGDGTGGPPVPYSFVEIDRYNLGAVFREAIAESFGEARTPPPESFGAGEHVSFRMEFRPIQGRTADPVAMSRRVISDDEARMTRCLTLSCLDVASTGDEAMPWREHDGSGTGFDRPYEDIRNGVHTPAAMADLLVLESGAARISDGNLSWTGFEESESVRPGEPFFEIVMDVNLAQDFGIEAVSWYGHLMDDSVAAIWQRAMTFPSGDAAPHLFTEHAFECARGTPGPTGLCP